MKRTRPLDETSMDTAGGEIRFFTPFRAGMVGITVLVLLIGWFTVPSGIDLPIHWNAAGTVDGWLPRSLALLLPLVFILLIWALLAAMNRYVSPAQLAAGRFVTSAAISTALMLFCAIAIALVLIGNGVAIDMVRVISAVLALRFIVIGNALTKSRPNSYAGIRTPWTLKSEANWRATHRLGGVLQIAGAAILLVASILVPTDQLIFWLLACLVAPMVIALLYSIQRGLRHDFG